MANKALGFLLGLGNQWWSWFTVVMICVGLEAGAVYYQEVLKYYPCEHCIYTRVWLTAIAIAALAGLFLRKQLWIQRGLLLLEIGLTIGLMLTVWDLLAIEYNWGSSYSSCKMVANFPSWARLDEWWPLLFKVQSTCAATPYVIGKISMAHGLTAVSLGFLVAFVTALVGSFKQSPKK